MILGLLVLACTATPGGQSSATAADPNGELITNTGAEPDTIDPHKASFQGEIAQIMMVFEGLMTLDPASLKPVPGAAAKDPDISADGMTWTFTLRDGLKYSDGSALTSKNYAYGFTRTCDPTTAGQYAFVLFVIRGCEELNGMNAKTASKADLESAKAKLGIATPNEKTIVFSLKEPGSYFKSIAYMWVGMPARESDVTKGGEKWTEPATYIGNGPFKLTEWKHNEKMTFERNDNYRVPVKLKKWTKRMINEGAVSFAAYRGNELDVQGVAAEDLRTIESDKELSAQVVELGGAATYYYGFNTNRPPFNDTNMRVAFAKSFDRAAYVRDVQKIGKPADGGFIPPGIPGYDKDDVTQKFDVAEAKKLFEAASPASKAALKGLKFTYSSNAQAKTRVEWVSAQWKTNLGVDIALDPVDRTAYSALLKVPASVPDLFFLGWIADFPDQQNWLSTVFNSKSAVAGRTGFNDVQFNQMTAQADRETDPKKRDDLYLQAGRILSKAAPATWLFYASTKYVVKPWVKGVTNSSVDAVLGQFKLHEIYVTKKS